MRLLSPLLITAHTKKILHMISYNNWKGIIKMNNNHGPYTVPSHQNKSINNSIFSNRYTKLFIKDYGPKPLVININKATIQNNNFRTTLWTGCHLQVTLMCIDVGEDIGLEIHPDHDQFIRVEQGKGLVLMGDRKDRLNLKQKVCDDFAILIPAGTWRNLINTGSIPLKLYSIYAPPQHPRGTIHRTKSDARAAEESHD